MTKLIILLNPLNPKSDQYLISPNSNTAESFTKIMRIKEMIAKLRGWDLECVLLVSTKKKHMEESKENMDTDVRG